MENRVNNENLLSKMFESDKPVLIDFYASWCGPCKMQTPVVEEIAAERKDEIAVYKINIDEEPDIASQFQVSSIPTLFLISDGVIVDKRIGFSPKPILDEIIDKVI